MHDINRKANHHTIGDCPKAEQVQHLPEKQILKIFTGGDYQGLTLMVILGTFSLGACGIVTRY